MQTARKSSSPDRNRSIYKHVTNIFPGKSVQPGYLRTEMATQNGKNVYNFSLLRDSNAQVGTTEEKLGTNDCFAITHLRVGILADDLNAPGTRIVQSYPNDVEFNISGVTVQHLEGFFNGKLSLTVGQTVQITSLDTERFRTVGSLIQSAANNDSEFSFSAHAVEMTPVVTLFGNATTALNITIPAISSQAVQSDNQAGGNGVGSGVNRQVKLVVIAYGFLIADGVAGYQKPKAV